MFTLSRSTARLLAIVPFAALLAVACEHNEPVAGELLTIIVTPNPGGAVVGGTIQYVATGQDVTGVAVPIPPPLVWSRLDPAAGSINSSTGLFTAGTTLGTFTNTIEARSGTIAGFATAIVTATIPVPSLGTASTYGILAGASVTCAGPPGTINADVGISPGSTITGFGGALCQITGATHLGDATALAAQNDLTAAYDQLVALPCTATIAAALGPTTTLAPGVYCSASSVQVNGALTLDGGGDANARFVIKAGSTLTTSTSANIVLTNGTLAQNVWWQVGSSATIGTSSDFRGNIIAFTTITLAGSDTFCGRALARNGSVSLSATGNTITLPPACL